MGSRQLVVESIKPSSIAEEVGIEPGDVILSINGQQAGDILDYRFYTADSEIEVLIEKPDGDRWLLDIEKDWDEDLGITFQNGGLGDTRRCRNKCIFCFVDQMPPCMRKSLYIKDDDYRLSFTQGNFITLTNVSQQELNRIAGLRLSPLYVSVHTTNPALRTRMMGNPAAGKIMEQLRYLAEAGIEIHAQAVLCPGINDGQELERTISDLAELWPAVRSIALVPVGLTRHRKSCYSLTTFERSGAGKILNSVYSWQKHCIQRFGYPLVFASDEFYLLADAKIPPAENYGGFPQLENGVGVTRLFLDEWEEEKKHLPGATRPPGRKILVVTGKLAEPVLKPVTQTLNAVDNLSARLLAVENRFFGPTVTVAGLLTATDIAEQAATCGKVDAVIVPGAALKEGAPVFLDDITIEDLAGRLGTTVLVAGNPRELLTAALGSEYELGHTGTNC